jgi:polysaccharide biosynthesis/export protein
MLLGVRSFLRHNRALLPLCAALITAGLAAAAQETSQNSAAGQASAPIGAAQPASQAALSSAGAASPSQAKSADTSKDKDDESSPLVKLGPGDLIEVNVYNVPELTTKARVSNSGDIYLPLVDYVHVGGMTQEEAQALLEKRLEDGGFVRNPHVTIFVDDATSQGVTLLGEVAKPGIYPDTGDHKLYEMISQAGGFTPSASFVKGNRNPFAWTCLGICRMT